MPAMINAASYHFNKTPLIKLINENSKGTDSALFNSFNEYLINLIHFGMISADVY